MRPGESTVLPFRQSTPRSPPGARSAIRQPHQSALFPCLLDPIFWVPQPRLLIQPPWVTGRLRPGPPRSGPRLGRTSHPASSSPVSAGVHQVPLSLVLSASSVCTRAQRPTSSQAARSLTPGHVATSKSFHTASLSLLASLRPQSFLGASPVAQSSTTSPPVRVHLPLGHQNPNGISTPARSLCRQPPLSSASGSPQPAALPVAAAPIPGPPPVFFWGRPYPVSQSPCASTVRDLTWAPQVLASTSAAAREPDWCLPLFCAVRALTTSIRGTTQGRGLCRAPRPTDSEVPDGQIRHPRGRRRGPHTLGPLLWSTQGLQAASTYGPAQGRDLDPVPAPCVIPGPPASSGTVSVRFSCARSHLGPLAPASTSAAAGEPARRLPLFCAVRALTTLALAPRKAACSDPQTPKSPTGRFGTPGVAAGAHTRSAPSSGLTPQPGPHSARGRHDFDFLLAGPSGAKSSGVRHLRVLGHAPCTIESFW
ncbi:hypothetical protein NDU88_003820 [Pleurodeles waltl]|uniref:Uncharacterized protein n=1 Tax=Pleurodeles waltl TaxID=8319 RepID=A0AAV7NHK8_PLEWA|nr:hypothetical protein NDU88_003820 [Pleurodeles waltl]